MSTVEGKKQEKRRALLDAAYELFLERGTSKTSVEDITSRAKVGKGTFYLYFADKGSVTQALLARVSYQLLDNACAAAEQHAAELGVAEAQMLFDVRNAAGPTGENQAHDQKKTADGRAVVSLGGMRAQVVQMVRENMAHANLLPCAARGLGNNGLINQTIALVAPKPAVEKLPQELFSGQAHREHFNISKIICSTACPTISQTNGRRARQGGQKA